MSVSLCVRGSRLMLGLEVEEKVVNRHHYSMIIMNIVGAGGRGSGE